MDKEENDYTKEFEDYAKYAKEDRYLSKYLELREEKNREVIALSQQVIFYQAMVIDLQKQLEEKESNKEGFLNFEEKLKKLEKRKENKF